MIKQTSIFVAMLILLLGNAQASGLADTVEVYKSPHCGCCNKWIEHLQQAGFAVRAHDVANVTAERHRLGMPNQFAACHSAKIGNYVIEGHVPAADIRRLLKERPQAIGLAVPSMPPGSPGMEGAYAVPYDTLLVQGDASYRVYAKH